MTSHVALWPSMEPDRILWSFLGTWSFWCAVSRKSVLKTLWKSFQDALKMFRKTLWKHSGKRSEKFLGPFLGHRRKISFPITRTTQKNSWGFREVFGRFSGWFSGGFRDGFRDSFRAGFSWQFSWQFSWWFWWQFLWQFSRQMLSPAYWHFGQRFSSVFPCIHLVAALCCAAFQAMAKGQNIFAY